MSFEYDHERFVSKNRSLAVAEELKKKDDLLEKKGFSHLSNDKEGTCFNCKMKAHCSEFKSKRSGGSKGVVSFGGDQKFWCEKYVPAPSQSKAMDNKQIKSLLKNVRKGY